jgi:hypothetical protein
MQRNWPRGIKENLGTQDSSMCNDKERTKHKVILMGVGMQINNNSSKSSTTDKSTVSEDNSGTSSRMSSTKEESTQTVTLTHPTCLTSSSGMNAPVYISTARNKQVKSGSKSFKMIQRSFQGSHASTARQMHTRYAICNQQLAQTISLLMRILSTSAASDPAIRE